MFLLQITPVKICDFDLASGLDLRDCATPELYTPVSSLNFHFDLFQDELSYLFVLNYNETEVGPEF